MVDQDLFGSARSAKMAGGSEGDRWKDRTTGAQESGESKKTALPLPGCYPDRNTRPWSDLPDVTHHDWVEVIRVHVAHKLEPSSQS